MTSLIPAYLFPIIHFKHIGPAHHGNITNLKLFLDTGNEKVRTKYLSESFINLHLKNLNIST